MVSVWITSGFPEPNTLLGQWGVLSDHLLVPVLEKLQKTSSLRQYEYFLSLGLPFMICWSFIFLVSNIKIKYLENYLSSWWLYYVHHC